MRCPQCNSKDTYTVQSVTGVLGEIAYRCIDCGFYFDPGRKEVDVIKEQNQDALNQTEKALTFLCEELVKSGVPANEVHIFQEATPAGIKIWVDRKTKPMENENGNASSR